MDESKVNYSSSLPTHKYNNTVVILICMLTLILGVIVGFFLCNNYSQTKQNSSQSASKAVHTQNALTLDPSKIEYLQKFRIRTETANVVEKVILVRTMLEPGVVPTDFRIFIADPDLYLESFKELSVFGEYKVPFYEVNGYILINFNIVDGPDDIAILKHDGSSLTERVGNNNIELQGWSLEYKGLIIDNRSNNIVELELTYFDLYEENTALVGKKGKVHLDLATGKIIPGTLKVL